MAIPADNLVSFPSTNQPDFIQLFMSLTESSPSPKLFCRWAGISLLAASLERRVWARVGPYQTFPNIYVMLVAPPGVGKQVIDLVRELAVELQSPLNGKALHISPDSMTKASMIDQLAKCTRVFLPPFDGERPITYHSMFVAEEEISVFMPSYENDFLGVLNKIYNNPRVPYSETRRHGPVKEISIPLPQLNLLLGAQPGWIATVFPEEAWSTGLTSRLFMIYASETPKRELFEESADVSEIFLTVQARLSKLTQLYGQFQFTDEAKAKLISWHHLDGPPKPSHSKLEHYNRRRTNQHVVKLSMISAVSRTSGLLIGLSDVDRAISWLTEAESLMPDIFRAMVGRSDAQVIEELHYFVSSLWRMHDKKPVHANSLYNFLKQRVPSDKIGKLIEVAERSNVISRMAGTETYVPRPKPEHGME